MRRPVLTLLLATLLGASAACRPAEGPVVFGAAGKWATSYGTMSRHGIELAVTEINAAGGIGGRTLEIRFLDDSAQGDVAAAVADSLVRDPSVVAVVGHLTSGAMLAAASVYGAGRLPAVATSATSADLTGISPWVFRVVGSDSASAIALARFADSVGYRRAVVLYENDAYGRGLADGFRRAFGGTIVSLDPIAPGATDFSLWIDWIRRQQPDLVFVAGAEESGMAIVAQARRAGLATDFLGGDGWAPIALTPEADGAWVGVQFTASDPRPAARDFVQAFATRFGSIPDNTAALAYDAVHLLADAVRASGADRAAIRQWLAAGGSVDRATGPIRLGASGDPETATFRIARVRNRMLVLEGTD